MAGLRTFEVCDDAQRGVVVLRLLESGLEIATETFLPTYYGSFTDDEAAMEWARVDARNHGQGWKSISTA